MEGLQGPCLVHTNYNPQTLFLCHLALLGMLVGLRSSLRRARTFCWFNWEIVLTPRQRVAVQKVVCSRILARHPFIETKEHTEFEWNIVSDHGTILIITWSLGLPGPFSHSLNLNIQRLLSMIPTLPVDTKASFLLLPYKLKRLKVKIGRLVLLLANSWGHNVFFNPRCVAL